MHETIIEASAADSISRFHEQDRHQIAQKNAAELLAPYAIEAAVQSFYGGNDHFIGRTPDGEYRSIVTKKTEDGSSLNETVGVGENPLHALHSALEGMRSLETAQSRPLIRLKMASETSVDFTELGHYAPKIAPNSETYTVPDYLEDAITDSPYGKMTYAETVAHEGWDKQLVGIVESYLKDNEQGKQLSRELKIIDLNALTPEQAVKLSLSVVQNLSKYSRDGQGKPEGVRADGMTTMQLLKEGIDYKSDPEWNGNGVCRNVASNTKAIFESLKMNQGEQSMLRNTYAVFETGKDGEGYDNKREDVDEKSRTMNVDPKALPGHAWIKFITVDGMGSANIAIVDPTWALEQDASTALQHMDYTLPRMAKLAGELFARSEHKKEAFEELSYYYGKLMQKTLTDRVGSAKRTKIRDFAMTEYFKAAALVVPEYAENDPFPNIPYGVTAAAYQLKDKLQDQELHTLYKISQITPVENFQAILGSYARGRTVQRPEWQRIERLVKAADGLQSEIFDVLNQQEISEFSDKNGKFRARLRELRPDLLPSFDPLTREVDAKELSFLAEKIRIHERNPAVIVRTARRRLREDAGNDALFDAVTYGRSDYDIVKNFAGLRETISKVK